jgi:gluconolactonase
MFELVDTSVPVERIGTGYVFTEGPVWDRRNNRLLFVDFRGDTVYEWIRGKGEPMILRRPSSGNNGLTVDHEGRLLGCLAEPGHVCRTEADGSLTTLASEYEGRQLNAPNDLVVAADGSIYFTDTPYLPSGRMEGYRGVGCYGVYRIAPDGTLSLLIDNLDPPNGLAISNDGSQLFVDATAHHAVHVWDLASDGTVSNGRLFADTRDGDITGRPDGMKIDVLGNVYVTANTENGIWVYGPDGTHLGFVETPEPPENCAWGDDDWQTLFVTARTSVYAIRMKVAGQSVG